MIREKSGLYKGKTRQEYPYILIRNNVNGAVQV